MPHNDKNGSSPGCDLSETQLMVIELLEAGFTVAAAGTLAGVTVSTIRAWLRWEPGFLDELNRQQDARTRRLMREEIRDQIHAAVRRRLRAQDVQLVYQILDRWVSELS